LLQRASENRISRTLVLGRAPDSICGTREFFPSGIRFVRLMGLLLVVLAVQFFINGVADLGLIAKPD
jgi:hypothetical protein